MLFYMSTFILQVHSLKFEPGFKIHIDNANKLEDLEHSIKKLESEEKEIFKNTKNEAPSLFKEKRRETAELEELLKEFLA